MCFGRRTLIRISHKKGVRVVPEDEAKVYTPIENIRPGDWVVTSGECTTQVKYVVQFKNRVTNMVRLTEFTEVTSYHPVRRYKNIPYEYYPEWQFPVTFVPGIRVRTIVYNLVLEEMGVVYTPHYECVVFGHNRAEPNARHDYFGSGSIVMDIAEADAAQYGDHYVVVENLREIRDPTSGKVTRYIMNA